MCLQRITMKWYIIFGILGTVHAIPAPATIQRDADSLMRVFSSKEVGRNNAIETLIIDALEDFRKTMVTGSDTLPVMDPLVVDRLYVDDTTIPVPGARIEMQNLVVSKLSTFNLREVRVTTTNLLLQRYNVLAEIDIPEVDIRAGFYEILGSFSGLNLYGTGNAYVSIINPELAVDALVGLRLGLGVVSLNIINLHVDGAFGGISIVIFGMFNDPTLDGFVNRFLETLVMQVQEYYKDDIADFVSPIIKDVANDILADINLIDILTK